MQIWQRTKPLKPFTFLCSGTNSGFLGFKIAQEFLWRRSQMFRRKTFLWINVYKCLSIWGVWTASASGFPLGNAADKQVKESKYSLFMTFRTSTFRRPPITCRSIARRMSKGHSTNEKIFTAIFTFNECLCPAAANAHSTFPRHKSRIGIIYAAVVYFPRSRLNK